MLTPAAATQQPPPTTNTETSGVLLITFSGLSESSLQFALYEKLKAKRLAAKMKQLPTHPSLDTKAPTLTQAEYVFFAGFAKLVASVITYPHEVVRTRLREEIGPATKYPLNCWSVIYWVQ